ncbi:hypothetical protein [Nannocystis pusilla]|uniref:hypothetical protein n=1 Tax=Nannocystis pusilla TaxID=889268 RepID=UPI003B7B816D
MERALAAMARRDWHRLVVVGGSPPLHHELRALVGKRIDLRLVDGTARRTAHDAAHDLAWADRIVVWGPPCSTTRSRSSTPIAARRRSSRSRGAASLRWPRRSSRPRSERVGRGAPSRPLRTEVPADASTSVNRRGGCGASGRIDARNVCVSRTAAADLLHAR